jgi:dipeptide/tripeptide permease
MSLWLLTVAFGNVIVILIAELSTLELAMEFFLYSGLMMFFMILFAFLVRNYRYVEDATEDETTSLTKAAQDPHSE